MKKLNMALLFAIALIAITSLGCFEEQPGSITSPSVYEPEVSLERVSVHQWRVTLQEPWHDDLVVVVELGADNHRWDTTTNHLVLIKRGEVKSRTFSSRTVMSDGYRDSMYSTIALRSRYYRGALISYGAEIMGGQRVSREYPVYSYDVGSRHFINLDIHLKPAPTLRTP